ncbi:integrase core domain-containing protein [Actinopolymorpha sp. B9G3]|uniref:integrase core domain-containing protein n=1 Tax=Actinopolymorpha sp. B9G3 TaxID=3158970 RepID=UPI0032D93500
MDVGRFRTGQPQRARRRVRHARGEGPHRHDHLTGQHRRRRPDGSARKFRREIPDGDALAVETNLFRQTYNTIRPHQALGDRTPRHAYLAG